MTRLPARSGRPRVHSRPRSAFHCAALAQGYLSCRLDLGGLRAAPASKRTFLPRSAPSSRANLRHSRRSRTPRSRCTTVRTPQKRSALQSARASRAHGAGRRVVSADMGGVCVCRFGVVRMMYTKQRKLNIDIIMNIYHSPARRSTGTYKCKQDAPQQCHRVT